MSAATALNWLFNFVLSISFPQFLARCKAQGVFAYYAIWCFLGWWMILLFVPETRNQTLEELDWRFSISARDHALHSLRELQYLFFYRILRHKDAERPRLDPIVTPRRNQQFGGIRRPISWDEEEDTHCGLGAVPDDIEMDDYSHTI